MASSIPPQVSRAKNGETTIVVLYRTLTPGWEDGPGTKMPLEPGVYRLTGTRIESGIRYYLLDERDDKIGTTAKCPKCKKPTRLVAEDAAVEPEPKPAPTGVWVRALDVSVIAVGVEQPTAAAAPSSNPPGKTLSNCL